MSETTILLADDSSTVRTMLSRILKKNGFHVVEAHDGRQAIEKVQTCQPALAILDIVMPDLDGYAVVEHLKAMGAPYEDLPILFLTCVESNALELLGDKYGAYLRKPVNVDELLKAIGEQVPIPGNR